MVGLGQGWGSVSVPSDSEGHLLDRGRDAMGLCGAGTRVSPEAVIVADGVWGGWPLSAGALPPWPSAPLTPHREALPLRERVV